MFSIIISEKGGAERREVYDRTEINVGRVQGNDLMLPKGNVSKRHARLLFRDGRFIVTDLKSTNGTYVNGRKIAQATIVREGDKIYIGDFVLRIESAQSQSGHSPSQPMAAHSMADAPSADISHGDAGHSSSPSSAEKALARASSPRIEAKPSADAVSHFPLEQDPDDSVPQYAVPGPPRMPGAARSSKPSGPPPIPATSGRLPVSTGPGPLGAVSGAPTVPPSPIPAPSPSAIPISSAKRTSSVGGGSDERPSGVSSIDAAQMAAHRAALSGLLGRVSSQMDLSPLEGDGPPPSGFLAQLDPVLNDSAQAMRDAGDWMPSLDPTELIAEARRELLGLGPIGPLLEDEDVGEIQVVRHDYVVAIHGRHQVATEVAFSSEAAVGRLVRRLCAESGQPLAAGECFVERRLEQIQGRERRARLFAVLPPASDVGHVLVLRKAQRADLFLDDLVRSGTISRAIATMLSQCVVGRANILVTGSLGAGATSLLGALAGAGSTDDRVVVLQEDDEIIFSQPHTVSLLIGDTAEAGAQAVRAAVRVRPDRLVVGAFAGHVAAEVVDAIGDGVDGVLAAARAPTLRHLAIRLPADLAATRDIPVGVAREWVGAAFDLVIEIARLRDGRHRVMRVAELAVENDTLGVRDIFTFAVERTAAGGSVEGSFHPTGVVPRILEDLSLRGGSIDTSIFKRPSVR
jgi:pilus assembly protein CpaF